jgi:hypothetical protein
MIETRTNTYPNVGGVGSNSLAVVQPYLKSEMQRYRYVPGLSHDDPKDLILMYMSTRYTWHGDTSHTVFSPKHWLILSPEIVGGGTFPEGGEFVDRLELKRRIEKTVAFLKEHQRPCWQFVAEEQSRFLDSLRD